MSDMTQTLQAQLDACLQTALATMPDLPADFSSEVTPAADTRYGDYQTNAAMTLARPLRQNPRQIANTLLEKLDVVGLSSPPELAGAGFINFKVTPEALAEKLKALAQDPERLGVPLTPEPKRVVVDFSAPNVAKPMHIGHVRSTLLGDALTRIARFLGHDVVTDNHIGDWGTQFGMVIYGYKNLMNKEAYAANPMAEIVRIYKHVNAQAKLDPAIREEAKRELVKLQAGDAENQRIWQDSVDKSRAAFEKIYTQLDIKFDHTLGESFYNDALQPLVDRLLTEGIAEISEGAACVFFREDERLAEKPFLIRKTDGASLYGTTDLATLEYRIQELKADEIWYVVGLPQSLHFEQLFAAAGKLGISAKLSHIGFGNVLGKDGKLMRTREGDSVGMQSVLDEAVERALVVVTEKNPDMPEAERREIARQVGIGAIKYAELSQYRLGDYVFDYDKMLALQGNTVPYLCYVYVRCRGIFRRGEGIVADAAGPVAITESAERALALKLAQFGEVVPVTLNDYRPNILANYLYELAREFHAFFEACPVLRSEGTALNTRLLLCQLTADVLKRGLGLLGIEVPERM